MFAVIFGLLGKLIPGIAESVAVNEGTKLAEDEIAKVAAKKKAVKKDKKK